MTDRPTDRCHESHVTCTYPDGRYVTADSWHPAVTVALVRAVLEFNGAVSHG